MPTFKSCVLALCCLIPGIQSALAQAPIALHFSHVTTADSPKGRAADFFRMRAEALTKGRVKIEVHPNAQLFKDGEEFDALTSGKVQMLAPSLAKFGPMGIREFEAFDIPFLFPDKVSLQRIQNGPVGQSLLKKLEPRGMVGLAYWDNGFKILSANRPLNTPSDMKGLKVRIQNSRTLDVQMRTLGATPSVMSFNETFRALQSGSIDGTENPPSNMYTQNMHEVQRYAIDTKHGYLGYVVIANKSFWDGLPADIRAQLEQALKDATRYANTISQQSNDNALAVIERSGKTKITHLSEAQRKVWRQALAPVRQEAENRIGKVFIEAIDKEITNQGRF